MKTSILLVIGGNWFGIAWYWYALALITTGVAVRLRAHPRTPGRHRDQTLCGKSLPPGHLLALENEAGLQKRTLAPGLHSGYWPWQCRIIKVPVIVVPQGRDRPDPGRRRHGDAVGTYPR